MIIIMLRFVLCNLPGGVSEKEVGGKFFESFSENLFKMKVDEMISTVDRNNDGRISFSEFR